MPTRHPRRTHQQWQTCLEKFRNKNTLTQQQFCEAEGLSLGTFRKHLYRCSSNIAHTGGRNCAQPKSARGTGDTGHFAPVTIRDTECLPSGSCLELPGNIRLHTQSMPSAEYLHNLVRAFGHGH